MRTTAAPMQLTVTRWDLERSSKDAREAFPHAGLDGRRRAAGASRLLPMMSGEGTHVRLLRKARSSITPRTARRAWSRCSASATRRRGTRRAQAVDAVFPAMGRDDPAALPHRARRRSQGGSINHMDSFLRAVAAARRRRRPAGDAASASP